MIIMPDTLTGEKLHSLYCAALWVDWPKPPRQQYVQVFAARPPSPPVAWPFLHKVEQDGWNNLANVLAGRA